MARVLIAEPDRQVRNFIAGILADFGHDVEQCADQGDVREWLRRTPFDVLATDLGLGRHSGDIAAVARRLPVVTLSGCPFRAACNDYDRPERLSDKPFRFGDLHNLVASVGACGPAYALAA